MSSYSPKPDFAGADFTSANSGRPKNRPDRLLEARAIRLLDKLPAEIRLSALRRSYPHVVNRIAAHWDQPRELQKTFQSLLIDERGGRIGFPADCVSEISELADYYYSAISRQSGASSGNSTSDR